MKRHAIYAVDVPRKGKLFFFYKGTYDTYYLFSTHYRKTVYYYFRNGKTTAQLARDKSWKRRPFLSNLIEGQIKRQLVPVLSEDTDI